ncbi:efflux RND transporter permease subunit [Paracoccus aminophilus]|uniref:Hydrophobic/amphiphilic exporter, HAE1 family n=1 Tax=Paracoccus aminophilus JCM 7686 TaxID=1367847 RepID=S5YTP2_PARAH|nr:efflux RND transporter permease subunit [Paracoccus aminophilus]AGT08571.1 hydrophobic/amphiphilic exporter, HAE1 family [Paracoccus aminophilus JCM 7686]
MFLTRISVARPVFTVMMMVALLVFGLVAYLRIGVDLYPKIQVPAVVVVTQYPGATPETVETEVSRPIEEALNALSGLDDLSSTSYEGTSVVVAQFKLSIDGMTAAQDVRDRVAPLEGSFPKGVEKPVIQRFNPSDMPILSIAISSSAQTLPELTTIAEQRIVKSLATVAGVGRAQLVGGQSRQVDIRMDDSRMRALGIGADEVVNALRDGNQNLPAGSVVSRLTDQSLQVQGRIEQPADLLDMIVARRGGAPVYLRDVARVLDGAADATSAAIYDGRTALAVDITKTQDANTVAVAHAVKARMEQLNAELAGQGVEMRVVTDSSVSIEESVEEVQRTLIEGAALAVAIVFLFLNSWRSTVITGLTLPISIIGTIAVIHVMGFTLNMMSLLGLTLSIGILVDDAIVVRENITRHLQMGKSHIRAALDGTNEIGLAVVATTATIIAVFLPVALMEGIIGQFFYEFGVTVSAAVLISLFVSFTLDPMLSSVWYDPDSQPNAKRGLIGRAVAKFEHGFDRLGQGYRHVITWVLRHRLVTMIGTTAIFIGSLMMVPLVGVEFVAASDEGRMQVKMTTPVGSSLDYTTAKLGQVEAALKEFPEVTTIYSTINTGSAEGKNKAVLQVELTPAKDRKETPTTLAEPFRERLSRIAGITTSIAVGGLDGGESPIKVSVLGDDREVLNKIAADLAERIRGVAGAVDVDTSAEAPAQIVSVRLKGDAASDLGINVPQLGTTLNTLVGGAKVTKWTDAAGESFDVVLRLPLEQRADADMLRDLMISTGRTDARGEPVMVRLDQVADFVTTSTASEIRRLDRSREVLITADTAGRPLGDVTSDIQALIDTTELPPGYRLSFGGQSSDMAETMGHMATALIMAVVFIYLVLASQFGSFLQPIAIMAALPLSLIGVILGLMVAGSTVNMFSLIGFIMLMGLVTKNGILLVDFANQERKRGLPLTEALVNAGVIRFRPIIMTTLAMIFGMVPLAIAVTGGGAQRAPMAHAVIGGLISSTILTLVIVPVILSYIDSFTRRISRFLPKAPDDHHEAEEPAA